MKMTRRNAIRLAVGGAVVAGAGAVYLNNQRSRESAAYDVSRRIKVATSDNLWCALTLVALEQNLFANAGIEIEPIFTAAGRLNTEALVSGSVQLANVVEINLANQAIAGNEDLFVSGSIARSEEYAVVLRPGLANTLANLSGLKIALSPGTGADIYFRKLRAKYPSNDVQLSLVPPAGLVDQFGAAAVDAIVTWEPFISSAVKRLPGSKVLRERNVFTGIMTAAYQRSWAEKNKETVAAVEAAYQRAADVARASPDLVIDIVSRRAGIDASSVRATLEYVNLSFERSGPFEKDLVEDVAKTLASDDGSADAAGAIERVPRYFAELV